MSERVPKTRRDVLRQIWGQITKPNPPQSGYNKLYFKSDNKLYSLNSSNVESVIGEPTGRQTQITVSIPGLYEAIASDHIISDYNHMSLIWTLPSANLIQYSMQSEVADTSDNGVVTIMIDGVAVDVGLTIVANNTLYTSAALTTAVNTGSTIDIKVTPGSSGDAENLTTTLLLAYT